MVSFLDIDTKLLIEHKDINSKIAKSEQLDLVDLLMDRYLFTASKSLYLLNQNKEIVDEIFPICSASKTLVAAYELLVALCSGCVGNLLHLCQNLKTYINYYEFAMGFSDSNYSIGTRSINGFVGLKNAGATCYMNSVLQQVRP